MRKSMSFLSHPDAINAADLQVWNNEAFDEDETEESMSDKSSWRHLQSVSLNGPDSFDSDSSKENRIPDLHESPVVNPVQAIGVKSNSQGKPLKLRFKQGLLGPFPNISDTEDEISRDEGEIDIEIKETEVEINRLASKLEALRLEKAERALKKIEISKSRVAAEIGRQKQSMKNWTELKESGEIYQEKMTKQMEIGLRTQNQSNLENSSIQSTKALEHRCYRNQEIDEDKVTKRRGGRSLSPMLRVPGFNIQALPKQGLRTVGSNKSVRKDNRVLTSIQPKNLFNEGEKIGTTKKPGKARRVVASRYNQIPVESFGNNRATTDQRKRSFTENEKGKIEKCGKRRASLVAKFHETESRAKKRWEVLDGGEESPEFGG